MHIQLKQNLLPLIKFGLGNFSFCCSNCTELYFCLNQVNIMKRYLTVGWHSRAIRVNVSIHALLTQLITLNKSDWSGLLMETLTEWEEIVYSFGNYDSFPFTMGSSQFNTALLWTKLLPWGNLQTPHRKAPGPLGIGTWDSGATVLTETDVFILIFLHCKHYHYY